MLCFFLFIILVFVVGMIYAVVELFLFKQHTNKFNPHDIYFPKDITLLFDIDVATKRARTGALNWISKRELSSKNLLNKRRLINKLCYWNNLWTDLYAVSNNNFFNIILFNNNKKYKKVNLVTNVLSNTSYVTNTDLNNNIFAETKLTNNSNYLVGVYLKKYKLNKELPTKAIKAAQRLITTKLNLARFTSHVMQAYLLNTMYWMQTYYTIRSGVQNFTHSTVIEIVWTIIPSLVLVFIGVPSFILLYAMDEIIEPDLVVKCIGHQWYWSYEIEYPVFYEKSETEEIVPVIETSTLMTTLVSNEVKEVNDNFNDSFNDDSFNTYLEYTWMAESNGASIFYISHEDEIITTAEETLIDHPKWGYMSFDSYMVNEPDLIKGQLRLLEVDNPLILPIKTHIDLLVTANDVLHCWTVPSFGVKMDAVPGRLNHANVFIERAGTFYGQCSEICGVNHGFMPIKVIGVDLHQFLTLVNLHHLTSQTNDSIAYNYIYN